MACRSRTCQIRTYGCQMNVHDSERLAGLLEEAGYQRSVGDAMPDVVVFQHLRCASRTPTTPALREPRQSTADREVTTRHADCRRRLPGAEGQGHAS